MCKSGGGRNDICFRNKLKQPPTQARQFLSLPQHHGRVESLKPLQRGSPLQWWLSAPLDYTLKKLQNSAYYFCTVKHSGVFQEESLSHKGIHFNACSAYML